MKPEDCTAIAPDVVQILAETEHNRWNVERLLAGYSPLPFEKRMQLLADQLSTSEAVADEAKKEKKRLKNEEFKHADIAPYDELLNSSKDYDINIVKNLLDVIK